MRPEITLDDRQFLQRQQRALLMLRVVMVAVAIAVVALVIWQGRAYLQRRAAARAAAAVSTSSAALPPAPPTPVAAAPAPAASDPAVPATGDAMVVEFDVVAPSTLSVSVDGGAPEFARLFQPGEHARAEATRDILIDVADAGAVRMAINGRPAKPLGKAGERQRARITRENVAAFLD
jgi:cytoskeleton protein RodZ